jgi:hypothetical protein
MTKHWLALGTTLLSLSLFAQEKNPEPLVPPEKIEQQLQEAEKEFEEAKKMFNPWYTGPLLTPSASVLPPPHVVIQPYFFYTDNYAHFDKHGKSHRVPDLDVIKPALAPLQVGITKWMDATVSISGVHNHQHGHSYMNWGDTMVSVGFGLLRQTAYKPAIKFVIQETFPTGHYQRFSARKANVESTGAGSYQTNFSLNVSKVVWWLTLHPMNFRTSIGYTVNSNVFVHGFNSYGGGKGTRGSVKGGNTFAWDIGYEYSFTQRWVAALDIVYNYSSKTTFSGRTVAPVGGPFNDQLSLAPAIEYNFNDHSGVLAGIWFTVWGRNSSNFFADVFSFYYMF